MPKETKRKLSAIMLLGDWSQMLLANPLPCCEDFDQDNQHEVHHPIQQSIQCGWGAIGQATYRRQGVCLVGWLTTHRIHISLAALTN
eukprot:1139299-Pelagomonas_calceolata.AAC.4